MFTPNISQEQTINISQWYVRVWHNIFLSFLRHRIREIYDGILLPLSSMLEHIYNYVCCIEFNYLLTIDTLNITSFVGGILGGIDVLYIVKILSENHTFTSYGWLEDQLEFYSRFHNLILWVHDDEGTNPNEL